MNIDTQFLFGNQLIAAVESLIKNSKNELLLISPFIDLDKRIQEALSEKINKKDFKLKVLFGKNENKIYKSIKNDSLDFLKKFPDVEIRYNARLHAKFFLNDTHFIMTSLNLYDYSLAKNIESGILVKHAANGFLGKAIDGANNMLLDGVSSVKNNVFGIENNEEDPTLKFYKIYEGSDLKFKAVPIFTNRKGISGVFGGKEISDKKIVVDNLNFKPNTIKNKKTIETHKKVADIKLTEPSVNLTEIKNNSKNKGQKVISATKFAKSLGIDVTKFNGIIENEGYTSENKITDLGLSKGLVLKNYMGREYIAYPEDLDVIKKIEFEGS